MSAPQRERQVPVVYLFRGTSWALGALEASRDPRHIAVVGGDSDALRRVSLAFPRAEIHRAPDLAWAERAAVDLVVVVDASAEQLARWKPRLRMNSWFPPVLRRAWS